MMRRKIQELPFTQTQKVRYERAIERLQSLSSTANSDASVIVTDTIPVNHEDAFLKGHGTSEVHGELLATVCGVVERVDKLAYVRTLRASNHHIASTTGPFHHLLGVNQTNRPTFLRVQSMSYQSVADSHASHRRSLDTEDEQDVEEENAETPRKHQTGENIPKKDKIKFLVNTLLDIEDNKEAVYGALDAWVAWERNFPIASLKRVIAILEKEHQWHRMVQVIKWILSKGQGNTVGTYGQLIRALDMDRRAEEAHAIWRKKVGNDLHSVPWQLCLQMIRIYFRNNMLQELVKLFKDLESYGRKPTDKKIVQSVADAYELLGMLEERERVLTKYSNLFLGTSSDDKSRRSSRKKKPGVMNPEADAVDAAKDEVKEEIKENVENHQESEAATEKRSEHGA